jgi:hypothetical protein
VDEESRRIAIDRAHEIDDAARQRGLGDRAEGELGRHPEDGGRK